MALKTYSEFIELWESTLGPVYLFTPDELFMSGGTRQIFDETVTMPLNADEMADLAGEILDAAYPLVATVDDDNNLHYCNPLYN